MYFSSFVKRGASDFGFNFFPNGDHFPSEKEARGALIRCLSEHVRGAPWWSQKPD